MDAVDDLAYYLAEWYLPEMTTTSVDEMVAKLDAAAASVSREGTTVRLMLTLPYQRLSGDVGARIEHSPAVTLPIATEV